MSYEFDLKCCADPMIDFDSTIPSFRADRVKSRRLGCCWIHCVGEATLNLSRKEHNMMCDYFRNHDFPTTIGRHVRELAADTLDA